MPKHKPIVLLFSIFISPLASAQILIDDGPIIVPNKIQYSPEYVVQGNNWDHRILTYWFANGTEDIQDNLEQNAIRTAMSIWENQTDLYFLEVCDSIFADIIIMWGIADHGCGYPFDSTGGILAHGFYPPPNGTFAGDIHFDDDENWTIEIRNSSAQPLDLITIAAHEIGHSLGLDHSSVENALMYPYYNGSHRYLHQDDITGIRSIYGNPGTYDFFTGPSLICSNGSISLDYLPDDGTIQWNCGPSLTRASAQGSNPCTFSATGSGSTWISASIYTSCGDTIHLPNYYVWVGTPYINPESIEFSCADGLGFCCTNAFGNEFSFEYAGSYNYFDIKITNMAETQTLSQFTSYSTHDFIDLFYPPDGTYKFWIRGNNECGTSPNWSKTTVEYIDCGYKLLSIHLTPNPTVDQTTIKIVANDERILSINQDEEWKLEVYTQNQILKFVKPDIKGNEYILNTSGWTDGVYYVRVNNKKEALTGVLIVKNRP